MKSGFFAFLLLGLSFSIQLLGQTQTTLQGYVYSAKDQQPLVGATVSLAETSLGAVTDANGFFKIEKVPTQTYKVEARFVGFQPQVKFNVIVRSAGNAELIFQLEEIQDELGEVVVTASPFPSRIENPNSIQNLSREEIATYPGGNNDIAKVVQSLPGVSGSVGFRNDIIIRGGAPSENVYYLDGVEIPNINHFATQGSAGGPVGLLNVSFIEDVTLSTSSFSAKYDNALSGVLQFNQRNGNSRNRNLNFRLGASEAALTFEGPLVLPKEDEQAKTTFIISARRSYLQFLFKLIDLPFLPDYWDYQYKVDHKIDDKNEISLIGVGSIDDFSVNIPDDITEEQRATLDQIAIIKQWTSTLGFSWKHKMNNGFLRTTLSANVLNNDFVRYQDNINETGLLFSNNSRETEQKLRVEATKFLGEWSLSYGLNLQKSAYENTTFDNDNGLSFNSEIDFFKYGLFVQAAKAFFNNKLEASFGIRNDADSFTDNGFNNIAHLSPRLSLAYRLSEKFTLNAATGRYFKIPPYTILGFQNNAGEFVNQDADYIQTDHYVLGLEYLPRLSTRFTIEGFYKRYSNYPVSIRDGVSLANLGGDFEVFGSENISSIGKGRAYGAEFLYQQKLNKRFYGILAYTLFWSEYTDLNDSGYRPALWDNRHLLTFTGGYKLNNNWELGIRNRFLGRAPFVPVDIEATEDSYPTIINDYDRLGNERLRAYNSLDVRIDKKWNYSKWSLNLFIEVTNLLGSRLPQSPQYGLDLDDNGEVIMPRNLIEIPDTNNGSTIPTFGIVIDF
ncbi:TonB-dependent receptor [Roseivirga seohaensis subsp. aquiponti]|uniref:TonB-dependent receptor n=1 Tax=Roseivirga seohaensis subsp. aquiponti TaxID=1566026 RepID=A0A0L8AJN9_9BACT|nr:TonB-dependent receptor [Roseivirga seohaensis]KOF02648.1 TonB-dependent receptor [Roseivirga seohaensis subsp. aquiponti]